MIAIAANPATSFSPATFDDVDSGVPQNFARGIIARLRRRIHQGCCVRDFGQCFGKLTARDDFARARKFGDDVRQVCLRGWEIHIHGIDSCFMEQVSKQRYYRHITV